MTVLTIPKELRDRELVLVPRDEYEELVEYKANCSCPVIDEQEEMSPAAKRALSRMHSERSQGKLIPFRRS